MRIMTKNKSFESHGLQPAERTFFEGKVDGVWSIRGASNLFYCNLQIIIDRGGKDICNGRNWGQS